MTTIHSLQEPQHLPEVAPGVPASASLTSAEKVALERLTKSMSINLSLQRHERAYKKLSLSDEHFGQNFSCALVVGFLAMIILGFALGSFGAGLAVGATLTFLYFQYKKHKETQETMKKIGQRLEILKSPDFKTFLEEKNLVLYQKDQAKVFDLYKQYQAVRFPVEMLNKDYAELLAEQQLEPQHFYTEVGSY